MQVEGGRQLVKTTVVMSEAEWRTGGEADTAGGQWVVGVSAPGRGHGWGLLEDVGAAVGSSRPGFS